MYIAFARPITGLYVTAPHCGSA